MNFSIVVESEDADNGWVDTHHYDKEMGMSDDKLEMTLENARAESMEEAALKNSDNEDDEDDEEAADMEEFEESGMLEDDKVRKF